MKKHYELSIRCYFPGTKDNYTQHYPEIDLKDIKKWVEAYAYTHDNLQAVTVKIWLKDE